MTEIQQTNIAVANFIIGGLHKEKPFNLVLDEGQTGSLFNIAAATDLSRGMGGFIDSLVMTLHKRVSNGTGVILEINCNADLYYHVLSSYIAGQTSLVWWRVWERFHECKNLRPLLRLPDDAL